MPAGDGSRAVAQRLRALRAERGLSLSELARRADVGKGSLSEIESGRRNPTLETLYALCEPLGVPLTALIGEADGAAALAEGGMSSVLLDVRHHDGVTVEVFRLQFPAGARHTSPGHGPGVREHLLVTRGRLRVGTRPAVELATGEARDWDSSRRHTYAVVGDSAEAIVVITSPSGVPSEA
ncbi:helix-turn-helix domain-containing protein [Rudaeicoccus suwonensis]|uniref:Helix-turn-helix protein n=1 Tax=Rudaeicoccus suwonensis TaxID=657409 RepID=A0A561E6P0_9MICO|nr:helix-turn-helix domain-containing protein [Rudaeicoccus suwonensis]TWE11264.1 helix-turn-helix protein [Rudaeicoccus suwonensis]